MHLVQNTQKRRRTLRFRFDVRSAVANVARWFVSQAFPMPTLDGPSTPSPIAKAAALHEGAKLSERADAVSDRHVA